jgi:hypothetical protein
MSRAKGEGHAGVIGQPIDDEVAVRGQRVETGLRVDLGPEHAGQVLLQEPGQPGEADLVPLVGPRGRRHLVATDVLGRLGTGLAVRREAVERRVVHPDPDREAVGREGLRVGCREVRDLGLDDRERQSPVEGGEQVVRPGIGGKDHPRCAMDRAGGGLDLELATAGVPQPGHRGLFEQRRAALLGEPLVGDIAAVRIGDP